MTMNEWSKRIRGTTGMGLTWAAGWTGIGVLVAVVLYFLGLDPPGFVATILGAFAGLGFLSGSVFSVILSLKERRKSFHDLSLPRFAMWGALGGLLLGGAASIALLGGVGFQATDIFVTGITTLLGACSATVTLALARRGEGASTLAGGDTGDFELPGR